jgi:hypothetical protein
MMPRNANNVRGNRHDAVVGTEYSGPQPVRPLRQPVLLVRFVFVLTRRMCGVPRSSFSTAVRSLSTAFWRVLEAGRSRLGSGRLRMGAALASARESQLAFSAKTVGPASCAASAVELAQRIQLRADGVETTVDDLRLGACRGHRLPVGVGGLGVSCRACAE